MSYAFSAYFAITITTHVSCFTIGFKVMLIKIKPGQHQVRNNPKRKHLTLLSRLSF